MISSNASYSPQTIAQQMGGKLLSKEAGEYSISILLTDSRRVLMPSNTCFFAIKSPRNDGHRYIQELINKGVRCFVISNKNGLPVNDEKLDFILVEDTLKALQLLAKNHRKQFRAPLIGITGSNGKTVVKEWLAQLLANFKKTVRSPNSYNSKIGVPLSLWLLNNTYDIALIEAGISQSGEMEPLQEMINPEMGVITHIGPAHASGFADVNQKIDEKLKLFHNSEVLFYCRDHTQVHERIQSFVKNNSIKLVSWGHEPENQLQLVETSHQNGRTILSARIKDKVHQIEIAFADAASIENAMHCWNICSYLGMKQADIAEGMKKLSAVAMRLELRESVNNSTLINDFYNSDLHSLSVALDFLQQQQQHPKKVLVLSDILESDLPENELYKSIATILEERPIDFLIGVGKAVARHTEFFKVPQKLFFETTEELMHSLASLQLANSTILLKGARPFGFERISLLLQQKAHETVLEVRLNNLIHNINYYKSRLKASTKIMVMVKAFSYGSGSFEIASSLQFHKVDYLTVAYADEAVELRKAGIELPIMVMSPEAESFHSILKHELEPEIFNFRVLHMLEAAMEHANTLDIPVGIHLKIDTGMHRLGFTTVDIDKLILQLNKNPNIRVLSVFSHLAASENPEHDAFTLKQIQLFEAISEQLEQALGYSFDRHILNSAGISRFPQAQYEMVRLGIGAYGISTVAEEQGILEPVLALKSTITQIKAVKTDETIGYNRSGKPRRDSIIGIVPIGYADGLPRALSNGKASLYVNGQAAPIIGDVCMDMCMIDVTGLNASEGDEVIIFDDKYPIKRLAKATDTIAYELFTRISRRVKRIYFQE